MALSVEGKQCLDAVYVVIVFLFVPSFVWFLIELLSHLLFYTDVVVGVIP